MRLLAGLIVALALAAAAVVGFRHDITIRLLTPGKAPPLLDKKTDHPDAIWVDDYFAVIPLKSEGGRTWAIAEPRYYQQSFNYLIEGEDEAILFDAGPGYRDIAAIAAGLTDLPITFVPSHFHYDHVGNNVTFERVAVIDLPHIRSRAPDNALLLTDDEHLGVGEGVPAPTLRITRWLARGEVIDLGGRELKVLYTPGHTNDSISLLDVRSNAVFTGDYLYPGPLYAFLPNSNMGDYHQATERVLANINAATRLYGAHRPGPPIMPVLSSVDVQDLYSTLNQIRSGSAESEAIYPASYTVNERLVLLTEPTWLQSWTPSYAD